MATERIAGGISWAADCEGCGDRMNAGRADLAAKNTPASEPLLCGSCRDEGRWADERDTFVAEAEALRAERDRYRERASVYRDALGTILAEGAWPIDPPPAIHPTSASRGRPVTSEPPATLTLRWCPKCGQTSETQMGLPNAHNPCWPDASPVVCEGPVQTLTYSLDIRPVQVVGCTA